MTTTARISDADRLRLRSEISLAGRVLAPNWPIETFIAVNPLGGLEDLPFGRAIETAAELYGARGTLTEPEFRAALAAGRITQADLLAALRRRDPGLVTAAPVSLGGRLVAAEDLLLADLRAGKPAPPAARTVRTRSEVTAPAVADEVDAQTAKWIAAFVDAGEATWAMPDRDQGFFAAWRALAPLDRTLRGEVRRRLEAIPGRPEDAALDALEALGVPHADHRTYLQAHLTRLPGWSAHVRWHAEHREGLDLVDLVAMRLTYEAALLETGAELEPGAPPPARGDGGRAAPEQRAVRACAALGVAPAGADESAAAAAILRRLPARERVLVWQDAYEAHYRDRLLEQLTCAAGPSDEGRPAAQVICCIDARSEGLRRHLEARGPYETLGFAGFFAVAIRFQDLAGGASSALCPVLLEPRTTVVERPLAGAEALAARQVARRGALAAAEDGFHSAKEDTLAPFALAEGAGWVAGPVAAGRTLLSGPYGRLRARLRRSALPPAPTVLSVQQAFSEQERALFAQAALTMMGLASGFARLVVLCGHGSTTENNPYASALDCGACGGNRGAPNARVAAAILNGADVRAHLAGLGIHVPADTWFVAAEHDTATDRVVLLDEHLVPAGHRGELAALAGDLERAGEALSAERCAALPGAPVRPGPRRAARHTHARSSDWAQVFPEWGLAGNAAFIVGPRRLTRGIDLERRAFLHSYDADVDHDGAALETILTAPLVVAQWINCQYHFSTVAPDVFGAGTKTIHNVVGGVGVLSGPGGDLQLGLPWQSISDGERLIHEPMRLLAVVQAPTDRIDDIVARNAVLQRLFHNDWVALAARERPDDPWLRHTPHGWEPWADRREANG